ncbi:amidohydrolase [Tissierella praeacuta]|uniref:amidohydrolase n=1 Tax=Tissierella praeacuta TaxID=43131 RepID=UPI001C11B8B1|nr:amidohydrolase [Tissierella praeacuta]MBU5255602.1 amidohydrolase [Tissierella praeacuta]
MDLILINGKIHTMNKERNIVEAIGINGDIIENIGTNEEIMALKNNSTKIIDLEGKVVLPGFNDSHMHLLSYGYSLNRIDLGGAKSIEEINCIIKNIIEEKDMEKGEWVNGRGWNQDYFIGEKRFPTRHDLDKISLEHPILIGRACGHIVVVNSKALELLNITKDTPQVDGGHFDLDENGEPLGIFRENALGLVYSKLPNPTVDDIKHMMVRAIKDLNKNGVTSVGTDDFDAFPDVDYEKIILAYQELKEENKLKVRVYEQFLIQDKDRLQGFIDKGYGSSWGDKFFKLGSLKLLVDGSLGARTAALTEDYSDDYNNKGITKLLQDELDIIVDLANQYNIQVAIHGIGDRAMYMALESIEKVLDKNPRDNHRHGIVHCQITDEELLNKFAELKIIAYIQPIFLDYDWKIVRSRVGENRERTSYNWKTMLDKNITIACGSDSPVETFNVMKGIYEAVTRKDLDGNPQGGWLPEQRLTVDEAVYGYTMGGAYASFEENIKGSLEEGKLADMVVLSKDIFNMEEDSIKDVEVVATIFGGELV